MGFTEVGTVPQGLQSIRMGAGPRIDAGRLSGKDRKAIETIFQRQEGSFSIEFSSSNKEFSVFGETGAIQLTPAQQKRLLRIFDRAQKTAELGSSIKSEEADAYAKTVQKECEQGLEDKPEEVLGPDGRRYEQFLLSLDRISYTRNSATAIAHVSLRTASRVARVASKIFAFFSTVNGIGALISGIVLVYKQAKALIKQKDLEGKLMTLAMVLAGISLIALGAAFATWGISTYISGAAAVGATALTVLYIAGFATFGTLALVGLYKLLIAANFRREMNAIEKEYGTQGTLKWLKQQVTLSEAERELIEAGAKDEGKAVQDALEAKWGTFERRTSREALRKILEMDVAAMDEEQAIDVIGCVKEANFNAIAMGALYIATGIFGTIAIVGSMVLAATPVGSLAFAVAAFLFTYMDSSEEGKKFCSWMQKRFGFSKENIRYIDLQIQEALDSSLKLLQPMMEEVRGKALDVADNFGVLSNTTFEKDLREAESKLSGMFKDEISKIADVCMQIASGQNEKALKLLAKVVEKESEDIREIARRVSIFLDKAPLEELVSDDEKGLEHLREVVERNVNVLGLISRMKSFNAFQPKAVA